ncbi:MAG: 30S ribosomal protein S15 [Candidatus Omnitrophica bacterium]|nr:30S ribosomal protein S15 [Candidatus Omnitrophota bacterium]
MVLEKDKKKNIVESFRHHQKDTGSSAVQVALLTEKINVLAEHFKGHRKDFQSRRGLLKLVSSRRRLLDYMKRQDKKEYEEIVKKLNLRK